jgi:hypothetical protein
MVHKLVLLAQTTIIYYTLGVFSEIRKNFYQFYNRIE